MTAIREYITNKLPGYSTMLSPKLDFFGREIIPWKRPWWYMLMPFSIGNDESEPIDHEILRLGLPLQMPSRFLSGNKQGQEMTESPDVSKKVAGVELTTKEYNELLTIGGQELKLPSMVTPGKMTNMVTELNNLVNSNFYRGLSDYPESQGLTKAAAISAIVHNYREAAKEVFLNRNKQVAELIKEHNARRMQLSYPQLGGQND